MLITPHIVYEPEIGIQGDKAAREFHHRHMVYADKLSPLGKRHLGRRYFHKAQTAWHQGDQQRALWLVNLSIHFDPLSRAAIEPVRPAAESGSRRPGGPSEETEPPVRRRSPPLEVSIQRRNHHRQGSAASAWSITRATAS